MGTVKNWKYIRQCRHFLSQEAPNMYLKGSPEIRTGELNLYNAQGDFVSGGMDIGHDRRGRFCTFDFPHILTYDKVSANGVTCVPKTFKFPSGHILGGTM